MHGLLCERSARAGILLHSRSMPGRAPEMEARARGASRDASAARRACRSPRGSIRTSPMSCGRAIVPTC